jgi:Flp pilus assembly pilin Flp
MDKMTLATKNLVKDTKGANFAEYLIIVAVVAVAGITAFTTFGSKVQEKIQNQGNALPG